MNNDLKIFDERIIKIVKIKNAAVKDLHHGDIFRGKNFIVVTYANGFKRVISLDTKRDMTYNLHIAIIKELFTTEKVIFEEKM